jgi:exonuclease SbcC
MIPITLELKNFLSYGPELQKIDFAPYHLMCLAGKNGHGKSGLLDAITWALWGNARKITGGSKADAGLLRLGQTHMIVILTFECNGNTYRVRREYLKAYAKPIATLDIGMLNPQTSAFESITDKSINITQRKIESIVGLNYDTFINSAFLRQGSSNEFSKKSPKERKEILASILGLDRFEKLRKYTFEKLKVVQQDMQQAQALIAHLHEQIKEYDALTEKKIILAQELRTAQQHEKTLTDQMQQIELQLQHLQNKLQDYTVLKMRLEALTQHEGHLRTQLRTTYGEWKKVHAQLLTMTDITHLYAQRKELADTLAQQQQIAHDALHKKQLLITAQEQLQQRANVLLKEQQEQQQKLEINCAQTEAAHTHAQTLREHQQAQLQQLEQ